MRSHTSQLTTAALSVLVVTVLLGAFAAPAAASRPAASRPTATPAPSSTPTPPASPAASPGPSPTPSPTASPTAAPSAAEVTSAEQRMENVISAAQAYTGIPYRLGAEGPDLMDCSGLIYRAFMDAGEGRRMSGARLGVRSYVRWFAARGALVLDPDYAVRGDLVIYGAGQHMGIYLGDGRVISALMSGVKVHALRGIGLPVTGFLRPDWEGKGKVEPLDPTLLLDQGETPVDLVPPSAWAPTLDPAAEGAQPTTIGEERIDLRTATSRTFENADGTLNTEFHAQPIYYLPADSTELAPIDLNFFAVDHRGTKRDGATVSASPVAITALRSDARTGFLTLAAADSTLSLARVAGTDAESVMPMVGSNGSFIDYTDFFGDGMGLRVMGLPDGVRTFVVLRQAPETNRVSFELAADGLGASLEPDGTIALRDPAGVVIGRIPRPRLLDSSDVSGDGAGLFSGATSLDVVPAADGHQIVTITVRRPSLDEAVYPAFVDFAITDFPAPAGGADIAGVSSQHPNIASTGAARPELPSYAESWLGRQPNSHNDNELYLRFNDLNEVLDGADIHGATLELFPYWGSPAGTAFSVREVGSDWTADSLDWLTRPDAEAEVGQLTMTPGQWAQIELSSLPTYGFDLRATRAGKGTWTRVIAGDQSAAMQFGPRLVVSWTPRVAVPTPWFVLEPQHGDD